jgi:alpha/beta superfamily hydrolase
VDRHAAADAAAGGARLHLDRAACEHVRFQLLAPCPASGIIIQGEADEVVTPPAVVKLVEKLRTQRASPSSIRRYRARTTSSRRKCRS